MFWFCSCFWLEAGSWMKMSRHSVTHYRPRSTSDRSADSEPDKRKIYHLESCQGGRKPKTPTTDICREIQNKINKCFGNKTCQRSGWLQLPAQGWTQKNLIFYIFFQGLDWIFCSEVIKIKKFDRLETKWGQSSSVWTFPDWSPDAAETTVEPEKH